jgi:hypothetical protein
MIHTSSLVSFLLVPGPGRPFPNSSCPRVSTFSRDSGFVLGPASAAGSRIGLVDVETFLTVGVGDEASSDSSGESALLEDGDILSRNEWTRTCLYIVSSRVNQRGSVIRRDVSGCEWRFGVEESEIIRS